MTATAQTTALVVPVDQLAALAAEVASRFPGDGCRIEVAEPAGAWFTFDAYSERSERPGLVWARWTSASPGFRDVWNYRGAVGSEAVSTADGDLWIGLAPSGPAGDDQVESLAERLIEVHDLLGVILERRG